MNHFLRLTVIFLAILLASSGGTDIYGEAGKPRYNSLDDEHSFAYFSDSQLNSFCLFQKVESVSGAVPGFPIPNFKSHLNGSLSGSAFEFRLQNIARQYFLSSREILLSLTIRDIIFPFHSFL